jgi:hypothetical protein
MMKNYTMTKMKTIYWKMKKNYSDKTKRKNCSSLKKKMNYCDTMKMMNYCGTKN